ncbi:MAG: hypothetical protein QG577_1008, partial [Thermodesulfobacteriota bacterium]|nr:hypothetical protein [Thermodesulfobacteriota bacterium]
RADNLFGTALLMNDENLFKGIQSERCLLLTDACHAGGFNVGLGKNIPKSIDPIQNLFHGLRGRIGIASSSPNELSFEKPMFGNSVFTHFLLKGLRGEAVRGSKEGVVRAKQLYDYVAKSTREATSGQQNPQIYAAGNSLTDAPIFVVPQFTSSLNIKVQFQYEDDNRTVRALEDGSVLKSGQHLGVGFKADTDCFLHILWSDSAGNIGQLFPNPQLSEGSGEIKAGVTYWLPSMGGERWYVLDDSPGEETIFVVASRQRNKKLEELSHAIASLGAASKDIGQKSQLSDEIVREINLMGIASRTAPKGAERKEGSDRRELFASMESSIRLSGAECFDKVTFKHVNR